MSSFHVHLCLVKHTCDTRDEFFEAENQYFDDNMPVCEELNTAFYQAIDSPSVWIGRNAGKLNCYYAGVPGFKNFNLPF